MPARRTCSALAVAMALALAATATAAQEYTLFEPLWLEPALPPPPSA